MEIKPLKEVLKKLSLEKREEGLKQRLYEREQESKQPYLKPDELKDGYLYKIHARNATYGIWKKEKRSFFISRVKFKSNYIFEEYHWDVCTSFGTVKPLEEIEKSPFSLWEEMDGVTITRNGRKYFTYALENELLEYLNRFEGDRYGRR